MKKPHKAQMGRPRGVKLGRLLHVRITDENDRELGEISTARRDAPNRATMIREALALYIHTQKLELQISPKRKTG